MIRTAVIYVLVNSLVLTFERTLSATLLLGLVVAFYLLNPQPKEPERLFFCIKGVAGIIVNTEVYVPQLSDFYLTQERDAHGNYVK